MADTFNVEQIDTVVIGGGQSGLSVGYHLARRGVPFVILDAHQRTGDVWRERWDSLRLFTPARFAGLDGLPFPAPRHSFPTKNEMADYLEHYARTFALPVRSGVHVDRVSRSADTFLIAAGDRRFEARNIVVAMTNLQRPYVPPFAAELNPDIVQIHSFDYRNQGQLKDGDVLIVGAGNSGAEIALEAIGDHHVWLAGRDTGHVPFRIDGLASRLFLQWLVLRVVFHRVMSIANPLGRRIRSKMLHGGRPLIRVKPNDLKALGVRRVDKVVGVRNGLPLLSDGQVLDGYGLSLTVFRGGFSWIDLPVFGANGDPQHVAGVATNVPGLYFVGLHFLYSLSSEMIHGVGRDADRIAGAVAARGTNVETSAALAARPPMTARMAS